MKKGFWNQKLSPVATIAAGFFFLFFCTWLDHQFFDTVEEEAAVEHRAIIKNDALIMETNSNAITVSADNTLSVLDTMTELELISEEQRLMDALWEQARLGDYAAVASIINKNEEILRNLYYGTMEEVHYLYDGERFTKNLEGAGLVLDRGNTIYYGEFSHGYPEGECLAIQAIMLNQPRYDYAKGTWREGKLEGFSQIGYEYYEGSEGEEAQRVMKEGQFIGDLMDGEISYTSVNMEGFSATWQMSVSEGVIQIDDRWIHNPGQRIYNLMAEYDATHAYVVKETDLDEVFWRNMILWSN